VLPGIVATVAVGQYPRLQIAFFEKDKNRTVTDEAVEKMMSSSGPDMEELMGKTPTVISNVSLLIYEILRPPEEENQALFFASPGSFRPDSSFLWTSVGSQSLSK